MVDNIMHVTYLQQRKLINSSPPPRISDVHEWPFLLQKRWLCSHFEKLTGIELASRLTEALHSKGRRIINYFTHQRFKWRSDIQSLLTKSLVSKRKVYDSVNSEREDGHYIESNIKS